LRLRVAHGGESAAAALQLECGVDAQHHGNRQQTGNAYQHAAVSRCDGTNAHGALRGEERPRSVVPSSVSDGLTTGYPIPHATPSPLLPRIFLLDAGFSVCPLSPFLFDLQLPSAVAGCWKASVVYALAASSSLRAAALARFSSRIDLRSLRIDVCFSSTPCSQ